MAGLHRHRLDKLEAPQPVAVVQQAVPHFPWLLFGSLTAIGGSLGLAKGYYDTYHGKKN